MSYLAQSCWAYPILFQQHFSRDPIRELIRGNICRTPAGKQVLRTQNTNRYDFLRFFSLRCLPNLLSYARSAFDQCRLEHGRLLTISWMKFCWNSNVYFLHFLVFLYSTLQYHLVPLVIVTASIKYVKLRASNKIGGELSISP